MPEASRFFETIDYSESEYAEVMADHTEEGVYQHADQRLAVYAPGGLQVNVSAGRAAVQGFWYRLTVVTGIGLTYNNTGQVRYDRIVLRLERGSNRVKLYVREGAPGAGGPALQRAVGGDWEISLAYVRVGPGVTDITAADVGDERSYSSVCGWANRSSFIGAPAVDGTPRFAVFPDDTNTGIQNPAEDQIGIVCGLKTMAYFTSGVVGIGTYNTPTVIYGGGTAGAAQERIYADSEYILIGRNIGPGTGPAHIHIGTAPRTGSIIVGQPGVGVPPANITLEGNLTWNTPVAQNTIMYVAGRDGYYTAISFRNDPYYNKEFIILFGTAAGQGLGGSGDASLYTAGTGAGRVIIGTQSVPRLYVGPGYFMFGNQPARVSAFNFQQIVNHPAYGIRVWHTNQVHHIDWFADDVGRHAWAINDVIQMWLFTSASLTIGGAAPKVTDASGGIGGFNFQQLNNAPQWGLRLYHTNNVHHIDYYNDDQGRHTFATNNTPVMWMHSDGIVTFGGLAPKASGFNYQQRANSVASGFRLWHTNAASHSDWFTDGTARMVLAVQDVAAFYIHPSGYVTIGANPTDDAALSIPARFGDVAASGIRMTNGNGIARFWVRSDGLVFLGSANTSLIIHHASVAFMSESDNVVSLGLSTNRWKDFFVTNIVATTSINPSANLGGTIGTAALLWGNIFANAATKTGGGSWTATSDERVKLADSIRPFTDGMERLMLMEPIAFQYSGLYGIPSGKEYVGFSAQALLPIAPEMVGTQKMRRDEDADEEDIYTVDTSPLIFMLLNALKNHEGRLRALEGRA